ncbi:MAG: type I-U CRISPR-associated helicase/endonuclease Cas3 [Thermoguttaceae bacterium]|jgi:CRISPR-associated endonuclease/helicase Cas3|nr:type I-U CRISPR-associated helicase/endonuclease Cas3 [Thermoguttaceae bacterium]
MKTLSLSDFDAYFRELHDCEPYAWQRRLAAQAVEGAWPVAIDLPTASGKTACIDIAIFALACQAWRPPVERTAPTRVFFSVNRRVIVDEAYGRSRHIGEKLWKAERHEAGNTPVLHQVAKALRHVAGSMETNSAPPLDVLELRGGVYRDNRWARSATQPTILCTTIDQLGSRLLFRGYGVSDNAAPIQAALLAYDSLILLDEAHISRPFLQTLTSIRSYLNPAKWAEQSIRVSPVVVVPMTATPPAGVTPNDVVQLDEEDRKNEALASRLAADKPAELRPVQSIVKGMVEAAEKMTEGQPSAVGVLVNRVATARAVYRALQERHPHAMVELVIGSMRPIDRDTQCARLQGIVGTDRPPSSSQTSFIVATQCLEVGADYDFDALVTECASLDALRQRFGRLNRRGRPIKARAVIVTDAKAVKPEEKLDDAKPEDPVYGNSLARTWNWLWRHSEDNVVDFGNDAFTALLAEHGEERRIPCDLLAPSARLDAPVILPAYIDFWCQTSPRPAPDPDVSLFIHGRQGGEPDVQVCWRADLTNDVKHWCDVVALLPPTSPECMTVPISRVRRWLAGVQTGSGDSDFLEVATSDDEPIDETNVNARARAGGKPYGVLWRGATASVLATSPEDIRPGDTLVMPENVGGWEQIGHIPCPATESASRIDVAEAAFRRARDRAVLRIHPDLRSQLPAEEAIATLLAYAGDREQPPTAAQWQRLLSAARDALPDESCHFAATLVPFLRNGLLCEFYPDGQGVVLMTRARLDSHADWFLPALDEGDDSPSRTRRTKPVSLDAHIEHVVKTLCDNLVRLPMDEVEAALRQAIDFHDLGKADERFQAMLRRANRTDAWLLAGRSARLLAKSDGIPQTRGQKADARRRAGLPDGFRHEMLSVQLAQLSAALPDDPLMRDLVLHLVAAHHGYARPFAPVVLDRDPPDVALGAAVMSTAERLACPAHRIDSGIAQRFWLLTRHFGWWGLAYLEAIVRLADQQASAGEDSGEFLQPSENNPLEATA